MSELHKIIDRFNELTNDNGPHIPSALHGSRKSKLRAAIRDYNHGKDDAEHLALIQPVQNVRKYKLRGLGK